MFLLSNTLMLLSFSESSMLLSDKLHPVAGGCLNEPTLLARTISRNWIL
jgi:hypothetical protein